MTTKRYGRDVWGSRVRAYLNSGMTRKQWCEENDINVRTLAYWIRKLRDEEKGCDTPQWLRINAQDGEPIPEIDICPYSTVSDHSSLEFRVQRDHLSVYIPLHADDSSILRILSILDAI